MPPIPAELCSLLWDAHAEIQNTYVDNSGSHPHNPPCPS